MRSECREAFERNEANKYGVSYEELKTNFDTSEKFLGERYPVTSPRHDAWLNWQAAWQHQQSKVDELQEEISALTHVIKSRDIQLENEKHEYGELMNKLVDSGMKNTELQKWMDELQRQKQILIDALYVKSDAVYFNEVMQALKGES